MKRVLLIIALSLSIVAARAQDAAFGEFFGRYAGREGFTSVELGHKMMQMMSRQARDGDRKLTQLLGDIRSIRMIAADHPDEEFVAGALAVAGRAPYQLMSSVSEQGQVTRFYFVDGGQSRESEFLMITSGPKERVVVDVVGYFDVKEVSRLSTLRPK